MKTSYDFFLPALVLGTVLLVAGLLSCAESAMLLARGETCAGIFTIREQIETSLKDPNNRRSGLQTRISFHREVQYTVNGFTYVTELFYGPLPCGLEQAQAVEVIYSAADPAFARARVFADLWGRGLVMILPGIACTAFGVIRWRRKWARGPSRSKKYYTGW